MPQDVAAGVSNTLHEAFLAGSHYGGHRTEPPKPNEALVFESRAIRSGEPTLWSRYSCCFRPLMRNCAGTVTNENGPSQSRRNRRRVNYSHACFQILIADSARSRPCRTFHYHTSDRNRTARATESRSLPGALDLQPKLRRQRWPPYTSARSTGPYGSRLQ